MTGPRSSWSSVIFDLDNDGDLDIVTNDFNLEPLFPRQRSGPGENDSLGQDQAHRHKVQPQRSRAKIRLHANGQTYTKYNDGKFGYLSQSILPIYFGIGDAAKIDSIEVGWPSGR